MPKGALLHAHLDATVNASFLLKLALKYPQIHMRIAEPLSSSNLLTNPPEFRVLPEAEISGVKSLTDSPYTLHTWVSLQNARNFFSEVLGGKEGFDKWVIASMMINPSEAYGTHNTIEKVQRCFTTNVIDLWTHCGVDLEEICQYIHNFYCKSNISG